MFKKSGIISVTSNLKAIMEPQNRDPEQQNKQSSFNPPQQENSQIPEQSQPVNSFQPQTPEPFSSQVQQPERPAMQNQAPQNPYQNQSNMSTNQTASSETPVVNAPGTIILQWLTYAFWGWTVLALSILITTVLSYVITDNEVGDVVLYELAAIIVLLPISIICDHFYSKQEPDKKTGAATIVMVIHAVIFALFGIGLVILAVFALVQLFVSASDGNDSMVMLLSSLIASVVYAAVLLRTVNPPRLPWIRKAFTIFMLSVLVMTAIGAFAGPVLAEHSRKNDRLVEENLDVVVREIGNYTNDNKKLPASLEDLDLKGDSKLLLDKNLLKYVPENRSEYSSKKSSVSVNDDKPTQDNLDYTKTPVFYYKLCATYEKSKEDKSGYSYGSQKDKDQYSTYIDTYEHGAGEECYKVKTDGYSY